MQPIVAAAFLRILFATVVGVEPHSPPDSIIVINARIWTGDPARSEVNSLVSHDGKFVFVGNDAKPFFWRIRGYLPRVIDAKGARIIPGLIDSHVHLVSGGLSLSRLQLRDATSFDDFLQRIRMAVDKRNALRTDWLLGRGWSTESWPADHPPLNRQCIDFEGGPKVLLHRMDGHCALANTSALAEAGLMSPVVKDPPGGVIERDPKTGLPTGILKDAAIDLVSKQVPDATPHQRFDAIAAAMREANRQGVTAVSTMSGSDDLAALKQVYDDRPIRSLRVHVYVQEPDWAPFVKQVKAFPVHDDFLRIVGFKAYMDGSLGSRTAFMHAPFTDQPTNKGLMASGPETPQRLGANFQAADKAGLQCAVHAIGDEGNHLLLDLYLKIGKNRRPRIEHAQHLLPEDILRFAKLGVVASMQPLHKADDGRYAEKAIGPERCKTSYAFRSLLDAGAHLAFGSDWPVVSLNPFLGIHAAVTGKTLDGKVFVPEQNITVEEALRAYTSGGAYACGQDDHLGMIKKGYLADFVILHDDPLTCEPDHLKDIKVAKTFVGGRLVWSDDRSEPRP